MFGDNSVVLQQMCLESSSPLHAFELHVHLTAVMK